MADSSPPPPRDVIGADEVLSLPPPPSHPDMDEDAQLRRASSSTGSSSSSSTAAAKAFSLAAAAKSRISQGGRLMLAPLAPPGSSGEKIGQGLAALPGAAAASLGSLLFSAPTSASSTTTTTSSTTTSNHLSQSPSGTTSPTAENEALAAAEAELRLVSGQQRMQILEDLVQCRRADWSYLKAMHGGTNYWLNIALLREQQVLAHLGEKHAARRGVQFFYLGLGLGRLISEFSRPQCLAMDGCQLLEELEFYFSSAAVQGMVRTWNR